ncbi:MAG: hypothetical protein KAR05_11425 [Candidatus Omnitrophica bacterium]|nr:hypothetical protein [Candidatus Omnitrophota bacterium]
MNEPKDKKISWNEFLKYFIKKDTYRHNLLLEPKKFIDYCGKRGVVIKNAELEFFEKEGMLYPVARHNVPVEDKRKEGLNCQSFWEGDKNNLLKLMEDGYLFHPSEKPFIPWENFKGKRLERGTEKVITYYSSFQIHSLRKIRDYSYVRLFLPFADVSADNCKVKDVEKKKIFSFKMKKEFDWQERKKCLRDSCIYLDDLLRFFLISNIEDEDSEWQVMKKSFKLDEEELSRLGLDVLSICNWYIIFSKEAKCLLGGFLSDWAYLFTNVARDKKAKLKGTMRLGVDYLQWAIGLKRVLEEHVKRRIFEVDEAASLSKERVKEIDPCDRGSKKLPQKRKYRNKNFYDEQYDEKKGKDFLYDRNKRLLYLVNTFKLDYQPRVMLLVEGYTEEKVLPKLFEWYSDESFDDMGIEIINFKGVSKMLSTSKTAEKLGKLLIDIQKEIGKGKEKGFRIIPDSQNERLHRVIGDLKKVKIVISNWTSFLSYNLEKWQIIPFFLSDNEGEIKSFLEAKKPIKFDEVNYNVPKMMRFLWGFDNNNLPWKEKGFEFANFNNKEISAALEGILGKKFEVADIQKVRARGHGIKKIDDGMKGKKVAIGEALVKNLIKVPKKNKDDARLERPIFKAIDKVVVLAKKNNLPVSRKQELDNKQIIKKWLTEE